MKPFFFSLFLMAGLAISVRAENSGDGYFKVDPANSTIAWTARKVTGQHHGSIAIQDGTLQLKGELVGGSFTIDMNTISNQDLQGEMAGKLERHLKSDDFFGVATYPTATLIILNTTSLGNGEYTVKANLTIRGVTQPIEFKTIVTQEGNQYRAEANLVIDRSLFNVKYGSGKFFEGLGDKTIYDDFELAVSLKTT